VGEGGRVHIAATLHGTGFHRSLHLRADDVHALHERCATKGRGAAAHIALLLALPPSVVVNPFELANLHQHAPAQHPATRLFGALDLEL